MDWIWYGLNKELLPIWKNPVVKPVLVTITTEVMTKTIWKSFRKIKLFIQTFECKNQTIISELIFLPLKSLNKRVLRG